MRQTHRARRRERQQLGTQHITEPIERIRLTVGLHVIIVTGRGAAAAATIPFTALSGRPALRISWTIAALDRGPPLWIGRSLLVPGVRTLLGV